MERKDVEVFAEASNYAIVRMPGRQFPGYVVQGDSLSILCSLAGLIHRNVTRLGDDELADDAAELLGFLEDRLKHYEQVLAENKIELPYVKPR